MLCALVAVAQAAPQVDQFLSPIASVRSANSMPGVPHFLQNGKCPKVGLVENFDPEKYAGTWYMGYKMDNPFLGDAEKCIKSEYTRNGPGYNVRTFGKSFRNANVELVGEIKSTHEFPDASMSVIFSESFPANYQVLDTDYSSYACVSSCTTTGNFKAEFGFVFSRNPKDQHKAWMSCGPTFLRNGLKFSKLRPTDMSCFQ